MKYYFKVLILSVLFVCVLGLDNVYSQDPEYFISPPEQTDPIVEVHSNGSAYSKGLNKNQDLTLILASDVVGNIHICGGRHVRVYGNGHKVSGLIRLISGGGSSNTSSTTGMGDVGDPGSFYIEGVYWPKYEYLYGSTGSKEDCVTIFNGNGFGDGRSVKCVIIQRCRATGIWGGNAPLGHGDFYQVQGGNDPLRLGYTYISHCTVSTGYTGFQYYKSQPGGDGTLYDNPRMRMVNMNWAPYWYTNLSDPWCNINADGTPRGLYFAVGLNNDPESQPGPGLHIAVLNIYAERIYRNGGERAMFNPNGKLPNNLVYEFKPGDGTMYLKDYATDEKSVYMEGVIKIGPPLNGDFMPESAFNPAVWKNIGESGGPSFFTSYQDGKLPEEMGIPFITEPNSVRQTESENLIIQIYPNPATSDFTIKISSEIPLINCMLNFFDQTGREIESHQIKSHESVISSVNLKSGIFIYALINNSMQVGHGKLQIIK